MEIKFEGTPSEILEQAREYVSQQVQQPSTQINVPENVTRQVVHELVKSTHWYRNNEVYIVTLVNDTMPVSCTCPDWHYSIRKKKTNGVRHPTHVCKHMNQARERQSYTARIRRF